VAVTFRRFRRARVPERQIVLNTGVGSIRQIVWELRVKRKRARKAAGTRPPKPRNEFLKTALPTGFIVLGLVGIGYSSYELARPHSLQPKQTFVTTAEVHKTASPQPPLTMPHSVPVHLNIPSQNIDLDIVPVDRDANGAIAMPPTLDWVAGWYDLSPTPGELGPAVIVGHVDTYEGISVFWDLRYVQPGDPVAVTRADGSTANFKVTALQQYDQADFPTQTVYGNTDDAELRLITCGGTFDTATGHYTQNTVVFAKLVGAG
jgi:sortase (surface protein transpeptidase)